MEPTLVFAGSRRQYDQWTNRNNLLKRNYPYVADSVMVSGYEIGKTKVICIGTYKSRPDYEDTMRHMRLRQFIIKESECTHKSIGVW